MKRADPNKTNGTASSGLLTSGSAAAALPPLLVRRRDAAQLCGVSPATWDRLCSAGKTPAPVRLGSVLMWRVVELADWTAAGCPDRLTWENLRRAKAH